MSLLFPYKALEADEKGKPLAIIFPEGTSKSQAAAHGNDWENEALSRNLC